MCAGVFLVLTTFVCFTSLVLLDLISILPCFIPLLPSRPTPTSTRTADPHVFKKKTLILTHPPGGLHRSPACRVSTNRTRTQPSPLTPSRAPSFRESRAHMPIGDSESDGYCTPTMSEEDYE